MPIGAPVGALGAVCPPAASSLTAPAAPQQTYVTARQIPSFANAISNGMGSEWTKRDDHQGMLTTRPARHLRRIPT